MTVDMINGQAAIATDDGYRYVPAPETSATFDTVLSIARGLAGAAVNSVTSTVSAGSGIDGSYQDLISTQLEAQRQMMLVSMVSNVEKSKHETQMAPVRNIRVG